MAGNLVHAEACFLKDAFRHSIGVNKMPIRQPETTEWPPRLLLYVYDEDMVLIDKSRDRRYDLNDNLFQVWHSNTRTVFLGIETKSANWPVWDEASLKWIETLIVHDLAFDGNRVAIQRMTQERDHPCTQEFIWKLVMRDD